MKADILYFMMKVKVFANSYEGQSNFEEDLNEFLADENIIVKDVKFSEAMAYDATTKKMDGGFTAYVLYDDR